MNPAAPLISVLRPGSAVWVTLDAAVPHRCPLNGTVDDDRVEVTYNAEGGVIEAESFATYLDSFDPMAVTIEDLATMVRDDLRSVGIYAARVTAWGEHGGRVQVRVTTEPQ